MLKKFTITFVYGGKRQVFETIAATEEAAVGITIKKNGYIDIVDIVSEPASYVLEDDDYL
jgi:hypothetical protein